MSRYFSASEKISTGLFAAMSRTFLYQLGGNRPEGIRERENGNKEREWGRERVKRERERECEILTFL